MKKHNFTAGPCILAPEVFEGAASAVREFEGMGLSLLEISHRDKKVVAVMEEAQCSFFRAEPAASSPWFRLTC